MEEIKKSLIYYDKSRYEFDLLYPKIKSIKFIDDKSDLKESIIIINNDEYNYNIIGKFDISTNFWEWGWSFERIKNKIYRIRSFLNYGLDIFDSENDIIKNILINARIKIDNPLNLDILLALTLRFLITEKFSYIFKIKESDNIYKYYILR
jgi:hypothetical protein|uniref:Uncharacterized protein n=1 Tax=viral metagenome TaxID=1070528 RepID=A0A6C0GZY8_9ZZZZ